MALFRRSRNPKRGRTDTLSDRIGRFIRKWMMTSQPSNVDAVARAFRSRADLSQRLVRLFVAQFDCFIYDATLTDFCADEVDFCDKEDCVRDLFHHMLDVEFGCESRLVKSGTVKRMVYKFRTPEACSAALAYASTKVLMDMELAEKKQRRKLEIDLQKAEIRLAEAERTVADRSASMERLLDNFRIAATNARRDLDTFGDWQARARDRRLQWLSMHKVTATHPVF